MKKIFALLLAVALVLNIYSLAFADDESLVLDEVGITFRFPEAFANPAGTIVPNAGPLGGGIYYAEFLYFAMPEDECMSLLNKNNRTDEETEKLNQALMYPFVLVGFDGYRGIEDMRALFQEEPDEENISLVFQEDDFSCFLYVDKPGNDLYAATLQEPYKEDFAALLASVGELIENSDFYIPVSLYGKIVGKRISFTTTDTEGNPVSSEELFAGKYVTMINIWASWCGPCKRELPELEEISRRLAEKNCGVVGLLYDGDEATALNTAKQIMAENGVTYPVILPPEAVDDLFPIEAFPTTYFVDSDGTVLCEPLVGAYVTMYETMMDDLLAEAVG